MTGTVRYQFDASVDMAEVRDTLSLAAMAIASLHGGPRVRLETNYEVGARTHDCTIAADTDLGRALNQVFVGYVQREFGNEAFTVERLEAAEPSLVPA